LEQSLRDASGRLLCEPVDGIVVKGGTYAIGIDYPTDSDEVGSDFPAYGTTDEVTQPTATLSAPTYTVTFLFGPPDNATYWAFEFADVTAPGDYALTVRAGTSSQPGNVHVR
jgi:hypothetical protein